MIPPETEFKCLTCKSSRCPRRSFPSGSQPDIYFDRRSKRRDTAAPRLQRKQKRNPIKTHREIYSLSFNGFKHNFQSRSSKTCYRANIEIIRYVSVLATLKKNKLSLLDEFINARYSDALARKDNYHLYSTSRRRTHDVIRNTFFFVTLMIKSKYRHRRVYLYVLLLSVPSTSGQA